MQKQVFSRRRVFCRCAAIFQGRILLRSHFCIVVLLRICFMFRELFLENTSWKLLLNKYNFIYDFQFVLLNKTETKSFCVVFCLMFPYTFIIWRSFCKESEIFVFNKCVLKTFFYLTYLSNMTLNGFHECPSHNHDGIV